VDVVTYSLVLGGRSDIPHVDSPSVEQLVVDDHNGTLDETVELNPKRVFKIWEPVETVIMTLSPAGYH
jgi:hypothetical protein